MSNIGLPIRYRFQVENGSTVSLNATVRINRTKFSSSGDLVYETTGAWTQVLNSTAIAGGAFAAGGEQANSTDLFLGGDGEFVATSTNWNGNQATLYFQPKGSTAFPDDGTGFVAETLSSTGASVTLRETFEF